MEGGSHGAEGQGRGPLYQLEEVLPIVLCHEAEESQEGPAEGVIAGVAIVGVPSGLDALITLRAAPGDRMGAGFREKGELQPGDRWGDPKRKLSFRLVCTPQNGKCSPHAHEFSLRFHPPQVLIPNHPPSSDNPGTSALHPPPPPHQCHSPSIAAVPTEQGVIGAFQEIEVPFGSQRSQRKHVTTWTLWAQYPPCTCGHICVDHTHQTDAVWVPLPSPLRAAPSSKVSG